MRRRVVVIARVAILVWVQMLSIAWASFSTVPATSSMSVSTGSLQAPGAPTAQNIDCAALVVTKVRLDWTATTSAWADGYSIERSLTSGGPYTAVGTVSGAGTTTYTDATALFATTYYYVVRATKLLWTSAPSSQVSITTPTSLCS